MPCLLQSSLVLELQSEVEEKKDEVSHLDTLVESLKSTTEEQSTNIAVYIDKLKEVSNAFHTVQ